MPGSIDRLIVAPRAFTGRWRITEMYEWDEIDLTIEVPPPPRTLTLIS